MSRPILAAAMTAMTAMAVTAAVTACSSSSSSSAGSPSSSAKPPASSAPASPAGGAGGGSGSGSGGASTATIKSNWEKFFKGSTPNSEREKLLQNGSTFAKTISGMSAMGTTASAKVASVKTTSPAKATVTYTVYLGKTAALPNAKGVAVLDNGTWKVSDASFCQLLALENGGKPPSVCSSAS